MLRWLLYKNMLLRTNARSIYIMYERNRDQLDESSPENFFEGILTHITERNHPFGKADRILKIKEIILLHGRPKNLIDTCAYYSAADIGIDSANVKKFSYIQRRSRVELLSRGYRLNDH